MSPVGLVHYFVRFRQLWEWMHDSGAIKTSSESVPRWTLLHRDRCKEGWTFSSCFPPLISSPGCLKRDASFTETVSTEGRREADRQPIAPSSPVEASMLCYSPRTRSDPLSTRFPSHQLLRISRNQPPGLTRSRARGVFHNDYDAIPLDSAMRSVKNAAVTPDRPCRRYMPSIQVRDLELYVHMPSFLPLDSTVSRTIR